MLPQASLDCRRYSPRPSHRRSSRRGFSSLLCSPGPFLGRLPPGAARSAAGSAGAALARCERSGRNARQASVGAVGRGQGAGGELPAAAPGRRGAQGDGDVPPRPRKLCGHGGQTVAPLLWARSHGWVGLPVGALRGLSGAAGPGRSARRIYSLLWTRGACSPRCLTQALRVLFWPSQPLKSSPELSCAFPASVPSFPPTLSFPVTVADLNLREGKIERQKDFIDLVVWKKRG